MITKYSNSRLIDTLLNDLFYTGVYGFPLKSESTFSNSANLDKLDEKYVYKTIATGLSKEDIQIDLEDNVLLVKSVKKENECSFITDLNHKVKLKEKVDTSNITAKLDKGVLEINLPFDISNKENCNITFI